MEKYVQINFDARARQAEYGGPTIERLFRERHIIKPDSKINGGIYISSSEAKAASGAKVFELITADFESSPTMLSLYTSAKDRVDRQFAAMAELGFAMTEAEKERSIVASVHMAVKSAFKHVSKKIMREFEKDLAKDHLFAFVLPLEACLREGTGICRHMAVASALLLEHFKEEGYINGSVSVDSSHRITPRDPNNPNSESGRVGHAWCRYTCSDGTVIVADNAQFLLRDLDKVKANRRSRKQPWEYGRPEDLAAQIRA